MTPNRARPRVIDTHDSAAQMFERFHARPNEREVEFRWTWPRTMREAGVGMAEMYLSNKWQLDRQRLEHYKHVAEGPRLTYVTPGFMRSWDNPGQPIVLHGELVELKAPMPKHFCILGRLKGVQLRLYQKDGQGGVYLPEGDEGIYEVRLRHGMLGGAEHPDTGETLVFVYTTDGGVHMVMTGDELAVGKDGIEG